jgi:hypothetical protein
VRVWTLSVKTWQIPKDAIEGCSDTKVSSSSDSETKGRRRRTTAMEQVSYHKTIPKDPIEPAKAPAKKKTATHHQEEESHPPP